MTYFTPVNDRTGSTTPPVQATPPVSGRPIGEELTAESINGTRDRSRRRRAQRDSPAGQEMFAHGDHPRRLDSQETSPEGFDSGKPVYRPRPSRRASVRKAPPGAICSRLPEGDLDVEETGDFVGRCAQPWGTVPCPTETPRFDAETCSAAN